MSKEESANQLKKLLQEAVRKPGNFAIVAHGANVLKLIVSKRPIPENDVLHAKKECRGDSVIRGIVSGHNATEFLFHVTKKPVVDDARLHRFIADETKLSCKACFDLVTLTVEIDHGAGESDELHNDLHSVPPLHSVVDSAVKTPVAPHDVSSPHSGPEEPSAQFAARMRALKPALDVLRDADTSVRDSLHGQVAAMTEFAKHGDWAHARGFSMRLIFSHIAG